MAENESEKLTSQDEKRSFEFDDIFKHVASLGRYQILWLVFDGFVLIFPITTQFTLLAFATGTPNFHCVTPNITCETKKCCDGCKSYEFDGPFQSTTSEVRIKSNSLHSNRLHVLLTILSWQYVIQQHTVKLTTKEDVLTYTHDQIF